MLQINKRKSAQKSCQHKLQPVPSNKMAFTLKHLSNAVNEQSVNSSKIQRNIIPEDVTVIHVVIRKVTRLDLSNL